MSPRVSSAEHDRILRAAEERGDFVTGDDGFVVYWPTPLEGALNEWTLRLLADELEARNAPWATEMGKHFERTTPRKEGDK